jgi:hypothetical protein
VTPEVTEALDEIKVAFPDASVEAIEDGAGGAYVVVDTVDLGAVYADGCTWIGFQITFQYPYSDVYPHFVRGDLARADGQPLGEATSLTTWRDRPAIQVSRSSKNLDPASQTAAIKLLKVVQWLRNR